MLDYSNAHIFDLLEWMWSDNYELMQYTWLKDKNWKEIYEGDIVEKTLEDWIPNLTEEIIWKNWGFYPLTLYALECEIIWNIYENPELLTWNTKEN